MGRALDVDDVQIGYGCCCFSADQFSMIARFHYDSKLAVVQCFDLSTAATQMIEVRRAVRRAHVVTHTHLHCVFLLEPPLMQDVMHLLFSH